ncbi:MAG TPA: cupin domain-containing protein [Acidobacteriaceae bacterium]|nr:cupin domain-containing protein [Acidobacteriaceae bacterium]
MTETGIQNNPEVQHVSFDTIPVEHLSPVIERQFVAGQQSMLARLLLRKGCVVPLHSHANEQITYILEGALKFLLQGNEIVVRAGEVLVIPSGVPHSAEALEDTIDLDVFCPPRADWINGTDTYLRR